MNRESDGPVFGRQVEGCPYIIRPSAYALVRREAGELAVARTAIGYFLPGGGLKAGEPRNRRSNGRRWRNAVWCCVRVFYWEEPHRSCIHRLRMRVSRNNAHSLKQIFLGYSRRQSAITNLFGSMCVMQLRRSFMKVIAGRWDV